MDKKKRQREDNEKDDDVNTRWSYHSYLKKIDQYTGGFSKLKGSLRKPNKISLAKTKNI